MKNSLWFKGLRLWVQGLLLLSLRWAQLKTGFDPATGLSRHSVPGMILVALILFLAAAEAVLAFRLPGGKRTYGNCMDPLGQSQLPMLIIGSFLMAGGTVLMLDGLSTLNIAAVVLGVASAAGIILFARIVRRGQDVKVLPLIPSMFFAVVFLLVVYLPEEGNPVLASFYLPVLAAALLACSFYQLAGLTLRECKLRWFVFLGDLTVPLCLASMADCKDNLGRMLVYFGGAAVLTMFLILRRAEPLPEEEPEETEKTEAAPAQE